MRYVFITLFIMVQIVTILAFTFRIGYRAGVVDGAMSTFEEGK